MKAPPEELDRPPAPEARWHFGAFTVWEAQGRLERAGQPVRIGRRSFDLLLQLLKRAGEFVGKDELLSTVWADVVVEEGSVRVHMSTLRKALGEPGDGDGCRQWISNIPNRGYRFNGRVRHQEADASSGGAKPLAAEPSVTGLPIRLTGLVGREAEVDGVLAALVAHRLVTIIGTGGIGKTSVAIAVTERHQRDQPATQVAFVDLSPLISPDHVPGTMARSLGAAADTPDTVQAIVHRIQGRHVLLLADNCEHVLDPLASLVTRVLTALPHLRVLATSREALGIAGEHVYRLPPLAVPEAEPDSLSDAMSWPSVKLLVERAEAAGAGAFNESHAPLLARVSRRLDGIPLAIELVAARLGAQSVADLASRLDDHMRLTVAGRAALARHKTLAAALEWSIALLDEHELRLFRRLSVFRGRFDVASALQLSADMDAQTAFDALISLANKSLVFFDSNDAVAPYRLLDTTRSYGEGLLACTDERPDLLRRHAAFMLDVMKAATAELPALTEQAWGERYAYRLDDLRFALDACLVQQPDAATAAALVIASTPLWFHVSQVGEYRDKAAAALALVDRQPQPDLETAAWLGCAQVGALLHTAGPYPELSAAADRALAEASTLGSRMLELQARWAHCTQDVFRGEYTAALRDGEVLFGIVQTWSDPDALTIAHRVMALCAHFCGRLALSRQHSEAALASAGAGRMRANMFQVDAVVAAQTTLCRTLWLQGETSKALATATQAVARATSAGNSVSLCQALFGACAVALWAGELALAGEWIPLMLEAAKRRGLAGWHRYAEWFQQGLLFATAPDPRQPMREVLVELSGYEAAHKEILVTFCPDWLDDPMIARVSSGEGQWCAAEVWRAAGWREEQRGQATAAEGFYLRALDIARQQGALGWELRAALSVARLWGGRDRKREAVQLLKTTCEHAPADSGNVALVQARRLIRELARGGTATRGASRRKDH